LTEQAFYRWRNKFGGMEVSEAKKLRELERESTELKKRIAKLSLDVRMLKDLTSKQGWAWRSSDSAQYTSRPTTT
jgi:putative transposase